MPSAAPSSAAVSEIPDAAPAFSAGAAPTTSSVISPITGPSPSATTVDAATSTPTPSAPTWVSISSPTTVTASPPATARSGRTPARKRGASWEVTTNAAADGSDHRPACSGDSPATSCRYCAKNRKSPTMTKNAMRFTASAAANGPVREQPHVDHRIGRAALAAHPRRPDERRRAPRRRAAPTDGPSAATCLIP